MKQAHLHAWLLRAIADGEKIELLSVNEDWIDIAADAVLAHISHGYARGANYRIKPQTITINGIEVPEPMRVAPVPGSYYWVPSPESEVFTLKSRWLNDDFDRRRMERGMCHATQAGAEAHCKALCKASTEGAK